MTLSIKRFQQKPALASQSKIFSAGEHLNSFSGV
jgi:hypothetical protein